MNFHQSLIIPVNYSDEQDPKRPYQTLVAKNGLFQYYSSKLAESWLSISKFENQDHPDLTNLPGIKEGINVKAPKIPRKAIYTVLKFFMEVTRDHGGTESQTDFYFNPENKPLPKDKGITDWGNQIFSYTPYQKDSAALTSVDKKKDPLYEKIHQDFLSLIDVHSHDSMSAFFSGTDNANQVIPGFSLVFGHLDQGDISHASRYTVTGNHIDSIDGKIENEYDINVDQVLLDLIDWPVITTKTVKTITFGEGEENTTTQIEKQPIMNLEVLPGFDEIKVPKVWFDRIEQDKVVSTFPGFNGPGKSDVDEWYNHHFGLGSNDQEDQFEGLQSDEFVDDDPIDILDGYGIKSQDIIYHDDEKAVISIATAISHKFIDESTLKNHILAKYTDEKYIIVYSDATVSPLNNNRALMNEINKNLKINKLQSNPIRKIFNRKK